MQHAAAVMAEALSAVEIRAPRVPVVVNVRAEAVTEPDRIKALLVAQVTGSVRWRESVQWMERAGVTEFWEIGAGKALSGMIKRIVEGEVALRAIGTPEDVAGARA
jgi:[acyl-carrier-protein] S-malonyltransferase